MYSKFGQLKWIFVCQMLKWPAAISSTDWLHIQSDHMHCIWYQEAHELEGDDPGLMSILCNEAKVHACMGLPTVDNLNPPLQQGRN